MSNSESRHTCAHCGKKRIQSRMKALDVSNYLYPHHNKWACNHDQFIYNYDKGNCYVLSLQSTLKDVENLTIELNRLIESPERNENLMRSEDP